MQPQTYPQLITGRLSYVQSSSTKSPFVISPLSGKHCFYYKIKIQEYFKHNTSNLDSYEWIKRQGEKKSVDFCLIDPKQTDKSLFIRASSLPLRKYGDDSSTSETSLSSYDFDKAAHRTEFVELAQRHKLNASKNSLMVQESALVFGDQVAILGIVRMRKDGDKQHFFIDPVMI